MRVLVTGGAGFVGSHTVDLLLAKGYSVRVLDSLAPPVHEEGVIPSYVPADVEFIRGDVRDADAWVGALENVDAVIHLAAYQDYLTDFSKFFHVNTVGTALLYEMIVAHKLPIQKVVVASSQAVYGEGKYICRHHDTAAANSNVAGEQVLYPPLRSEAQLVKRDWNVHCAECDGTMEWTLTDEAHVNPHNQYAMSKYTQEMLALNFGQRYQVPTVCLRYSIVQGARQSFRNAYSGILRNFTQRLMAGHAPVCYEDGLQVRDYVYVGDVARANLLALEDERANFQSFNVGGERAITVREYAELLQKKLHSTVALECPGIYRFGDTRHIVSDVSKIKALGWNPTKTIEEIADEYIVWAAAQPGLQDYYAEAQAGMLKRGSLRRAD